MIIKSKRARNLIILSKIYKTIHYVHYIVKKMEDALMPTSGQILVDLVSEKPLAAQSNLGADVVMIYDDV